MEGCTSLLFPVTPAFSRIRWTNCRWCSHEDSGWSWADAFCRKNTHQSATVDAQLIHASFHGQFKWLGLNANLLCFLSKPSVRRFDSPQRTEFLVIPIFRFFSAVWGFDWRFYCMLLLPDRSSFRKLSHQFTSLPVYLFTWTMCKWSRFFLQNLQVSDQASAGSLGSPAGCRPVGSEWLIEGSAFMHRNLSGLLVDSSLKASSAAVWLQVWLPLKEPNNRLATKQPSPPTVSSKFYELNVL